MFRLSDIGKFFPGCARLDFEQILDSVAFRFVESLKTIIQTRECLPWCHCRSSNDKCKIACKWQGAQLISADLKFYTLALYVELRTKLSTDGILGLQVESKECCDVKQKWFGKKHLAIKWKWSHYRTRNPWMITTWSCPRISNCKDWVQVEDMILYKAVILVCNFFLHSLLFGWLFQAGPVRTAMKSHSHQLIEVPGGYSQKPKGRLQWFTKSGSVKSILIYTPENDRVPLKRD